MDILAEIYKGIENKGYDDFTKIRWIYLYICEKFSYDIRYHHATNNMKEEIYNVKVDIQNVEEFEIVCYTLSRVLCDVLKEFGYKCEVELETNRPLTHAYVVVEHKGYKLKLDPTKRYDVARVKMNSTTKDFVSLVDDDIFTDQLLETDKKIASQFDGLYLTKKFIKTQIANKLKEIDTYAIENGLNRDEIFFKKLDTLYEMINSRTDLTRYADIDFYYSYLLKTFKFDYEGDLGNNDYKKPSCIRPAVLFRIDDRSMKDVINITYIQYKDLPPMFYLLKKEGKNFKVREIFKEEALELLEEYYCFNCQYLLEQAAEQLPTCKQKGIIY